jgi:hypothetical protein
MATEIDAIDCCVQVSWEYSYEKDDYGDPNESWVPPCHQACDILRAPSLVAADSNRKLPSRIPRRNISVTSAYERAKERLRELRPVNLGLVEWVVPPDTFTVRQDDEREIEGRDLQI